jgi:hypothetical protein
MQRFRKFDYVRVVAMTDLAGNPYNREYENQFLNKIGFINETLIGRDYDYKVMFTRRDKQTFFEVFHDYEVELFRGEG